MYCVKVVINVYFVKPMSNNSFQDLLKDTERSASTVASSKNNVSKNRGNIIPCELPINVDLFTFTFQFDFLNLTSIPSCVWGCLYFQMTLIVLNYVHLEQVTTSMLVFCWYVKNPDMIFLFFRLFKIVKYFLPLYCQDKCYIFTSYPIAKTFGNFWQMVWEQNVSTIVVMTGHSDDREVYATL